MNCERIEEAAAYDEGRLDAAESVRFLEHAADCDECRRAAALAATKPAAPEAAFSEESEARAVSALSRALLRSGRPFRPSRRFRPGSAFRAGPIITGAAAGLLFGLLVFGFRDRRPAEPLRAPQPEPAREARVPAPSPVPGLPAAPRTAEAPAAPEAPQPREPERTVPAPQPKPQPQPQPPAPAPVPAPAVAVGPSAPPPAETRPEEPARETIASAPRTFAELQVTDASGLTVRRKGTGPKDRLAGAARLSSGDVVSAEKGGCLRVDGRHAVVLGENASISVAWTSPEQAPFLHVRAGEAVVDSSSPTRWVLSDGRASVVVKPVQGRFAAAVSGQVFAIAALSEGIYAEPDGGRVRALRPGQALAIERGLAEIRDAAEDARRRAAMADAGRPRERTLLWSGFDAADLKREQFVLQEGAVAKGDVLLGRVLPDRTIVAALAPNPRFSWSAETVVRFRYYTNAQSLQVSMRCDDRGYVLAKTVPVERRSMNQWLVMEAPLDLSSWTFRRDDGQSQLTVSTADRFDSLRIQVRQQEVFGDGKPVLAVDDVQVVVKE